MESVVLAKFLGVFFLVLGVGFLTNREHAANAAADLVKHPASQTIAGIIPLLLGSFVVATHNVWSPNLSVLVTIAGWFLLLASVFRLWFVSTWVAMVEKASEHGVVMAAFVVLILGALLFYVGFLGG